MQIVAVMGRFIGANGDIMGDTEQRFVIGHGQRLLNKFNSHGGAGCHEES
jgi:hypothetical protein